MYIYLIFDPFSRLTKIGKSKNPQKRFLAIKTSNPNAELFFYSSDYTEDVLHEMFKLKRERGEWFALDKYDIFQITKSFKCIPKRLHYNNTKKDLIRKSINEKKNKLFEYSFIGEMPFSPHYKFTKCKKLFNTKTMREIKKTVNCYSVGYWISKKFYTLEDLRNCLVKIENGYCPF